ASCSSVSIQGKRVAMPGGRQVKSPTCEQPSAAARSTSSTGDSCSAVRWCSDSDAEPAWVALTVLYLGLGDMQNQLAVEFRRELDLAAQAAGFAALGSHRFQQIVFQRVDRRQQIDTGLIDIDVAGGA